MLTVCSALCRRCDSQLQSTICKVHTGKTFSSLLRQSQRCPACSSIALCANTPTLLAGSNTSRIRVMATPRRCHGL